MINAEKIIERYGEIMFINGSSCKGFVSPLSHKSADSLPQATPVGVKKRARYLIITAGALEADGGDTVVCDGRSLTTLRAEPFYVMGRLSHYEALAEVEDA